MYGFSVAACVNASIAASNSAPANNVLPRSRYASALTGSRSIALLIGAVAFAVSSA